MSEPLDASAGREQAKRNWAEPDKKLKGLFEKYLNFAAGTEKKFYKDLDPIDRWGLYDYANEHLRGIQVTFNEAYGLIVGQGLTDEEKSYAGFFVSAIYNNSEVKNIVYDASIGLENLAYCLPWGKAFINRGGDYRHSGTNASGIIVNYLENKNIGCVSVGYNANGSVITYGGCAITGCNDDEDDMHHMETVSLEVNVLEKVEINVDKGCIYIGDAIRIKKGLYDTGSEFSMPKEEIDKFAELREYVDDLKAKFEQGRHDYRIVVDAIHNLGPRPEDKIRQDLEHILKRAGRDV